MGRVDPEESDNEDITMKRRAVIHNTIDDESCLEREQRGEIRSSVSVERGLREQGEVSSFTNVSGMCDEHLRGVAGHEDRARPDEA